MRRELIAVAVLLATSSAWAQPASYPQAPLSASATLPLEDVLKLKEAAQKPPEPNRPPLASSLDEVVLTGRLLADSLEATAQFKVSVLGEGWVRVPLLKLDAETHVQSVTGQDGVVIAADGDWLVAITSAAGAHPIQVAFSKSARVEGRRRTLELGVEKSAVSVLRARFDADLFRLAGPGQRGDELVAYPEKGRFTVAWELKAEPTVAAPVEARRPPAESVITSAHASVTCTLDGLQFTRVLYELRLQGAQQLEFTLPAGQVVRKAYLNGNAIPFAVEGASLKVAVAPARAGEDAARLELGIEGDRREFHLSGPLVFAFPAASWRVNQLHVSMHLPQVFNYRWTGGSLAPWASGDPADYAQSMPTPGKDLFFRQELITSAPDLRLEYAVDLEKQYFRAASY